MCLHCSSTCPCSIATSKQSRIKQLNLSICIRHYFFISSCAVQLLIGWDQGHGLLDNGQRLDVLSKQFTCERYSFTYFQWRPCIFIIAELIRKILPYNSRVRLIQEKVPMEVNGCHLSAKYWKLSLNRLDTGQSNRKSETCLYCSEKKSHHATLYIINPCRCRATSNPFFYLYKTRFFISPLVLFSCLRMRSEPGCVI